MELINILNIFSQKKKVVNVVLSVLFFVRLHALATCFFSPSRVPSYKTEMARWIFPAA